MSGPPVDPAALEAWLDAHQAEQLELLQALVRAESPSTDADSQEAVFTLLAEHLEGSGFAWERREGARTGGLLHAWPVERAPDRPLQVLLGHCDTVWPLGSLQRMPLRQDDGELHGPGVYDMKGGLAQLLQALRALRALDVRWTVDPVVVINADEEIGSTETRAFIDALARRADRALVLEPSLGREGRLKTARKGVGRFELRVHGRAAHAGLDPGAGVSAILELSHLIQQLFALNDPERGVTVNVGTIDGGLQPNVVAPESRAVVDVRVPSLVDAERVEAAIRSLRPQAADARIEVQGGFGRPPMERTPANRALWALARRLGEAHGLELQQGTAGGGSDGNFTSLHTATLDGLGAVGDGAHAEHEFIRLDALRSRTALLAQLVAAPPLHEADAA